MKSLPILSDALRRRFEREAKRQANMRRVCGYRLSDGSLSDNLIVFDYVDIGLMRDYFARVFSSVDIKPEMRDIAFVYLGVWYKDKRKFDFLDDPDVIFTLGDFVERKDQNA